MSSLILLATLGVESLRIGEWTSVFDNLEGPAAIAQHPEGGIVIADRLTGSIDRLVASGDLTRLAEGFAGPEGVAVHATEGWMLVADTAADQVHVVAADGTRTLLGSKGTSQGSFCAPRGVAISADGSLAIADTGNDRVVLMHPDGLGTFSEQRLILGDFEQPTDVHFTPKGDLLVADSGNDRVVQVKRGAAQARTNIGVHGAFPGFLDEPIAITFTDRPVVLDRRNHRLQALTGDGEAQWLYGEHAYEFREAGGKFHYPDDVVFDVDSKQAWVLERTERRVQLFSLVPHDPALEEFVPPPAGMRAHLGPRCVVDGDLLVMTEPEAQRIFLFDARGEIPILIGQWGERGREMGLLMRSEAIALDATNQRVYLADRVNERLVELAFDWDGTVGYAENRFRMVRSIDLVAWTKARLPEASWTLRPDDLWFDGNQLHFADARNALVGVFDERWRPTLLADASTGLSAPTQVRKDPNGQYVILDANRRALFGLDQEAPRLQAIPTGTKEPGGFVYQADGALFVTDRAEDELVRIQASGRSVLAQTGSDHGELWQPAGLAIAPDGRLLVMDVGNHRAQAFDAQGKWCLTFGTGRAVTPKTRDLRRPSLLSEE